MPPCIEEGLEISRIGVSDAKVDAKQYARETGAANDSANDDICYIEVRHFQISLHLEKFVETQCLKGKWAEFGWAEFLSKKGNLFSFAK